MLMAARLGIIIKKKTFQTFLLCLGRLAASWARVYPRAMLLNWIGVRENDDEGLMKISYNSSVLGWF